MSKLTENSFKTCLEVLKNLVNDQALLDTLSEEERVELLTLSGKISRPNRDEIKERNKEITKARKLAAREKNRQARAKTGIRKARLQTVFSAPLQITSSEAIETEELKTPRNCYVCKAEYKKLHFFYDTMCRDCGDFNYQKRFQTTSLKGKVAVITGSRLKIGYHATLMLLRAGAEVVATTRFPHDSALRFSKEADFSAWSDRLHIYGLDLRHTPSVELFARYLQQKLGRLDILINNAAQTVRRPPGFYAHLMPSENLPHSELPEGARHILRQHEDCKKSLNAFATDTAALPVSWNRQAPAMGIYSSASLSQIPYSYDQSLSVKEVFPDGKLDADLQQVDLRTTNSWRLKLADVPAPEMLEVQLVNAVAPFILCSQLTPIMRRDNTGEKHIVNVTAMEGKFYRFRKEDRHPHTNMAKAALNMLTHTSASDLQKDGIYMNAVDTGWVTDEDPAALSTYKQETHDFQPPLDIVDGAARVCDPFFHGILTGHHWCGKFLKDYQPIDW
ncbi:MAG: SDR family oxidoreductase [Bdellovibrionales bacterium]|nr:SDR family oxidoreductase [Bdellovibrionales bacterium]